MGFNIKERSQIFFDPTLADAIMDRVLSNSYKIELKGRSRRGILENNIEL